MSDGTEPDDKFEVIAESINGAPPITFHFFDDATARAELADAVLVAEATTSGRSTELTITCEDGAVLAKLLVHPRKERTQVQNLVDIGSALLWSHWRWMQAPADVRAEALAPAKENP